MKIDEKELKIGDIVFFKCSNYRITLHTIKEIDEQSKQIKVSGNLIDLRDRTSNETKNFLSIGYFQVGNLDFLKKINSFEELSLIDQREINKIKEEEQNGNNLDKAK